MKSSLLALGVLMLGVTAASAAPMCTSQTLDIYTVPGFSCMIGDKTFSGFTALLAAVAPVGSTAVPAATSQILVVPGGSSTAASFNFLDGFTASGVLATDSFTVLFTGTAPANDPFTSDALSLTNPNVSGLGAAITALEALCFNGSFTTIALPVCGSGVGANLGLTSQITNANLGATINLNFAPITTLGVAKQLNLVGALGATATVTSINNVIGATPTGPGPGPTVPEPGTSVLAVSALGLFALLQRRIRSHRNA